MSTPSIKVGQGNWGIKAGNLLGYANTEKKFSPVEFTSTRSLNTATRVNASGNIEIVNQNIPRIDYLGGQASLLVEPSGTNGILNSTDTTTNWALGTSLTSASIDVIGVSGNNLTVAVSGSNIGVNIGGLRRANNNFALASGSIYTISFLLKKTGSHTIGGYYATITGAATGDIGGGFDVSGSFSSGQVINTAGTTNRIRRVERWGTDVYRCSETFTMTASGTLTTFRLGPITSVTSANNPDLGVELGFAAPQIELGSVATSFIPTTTGSVTRNADVVSVTGVAGLIGQTEGTLYAEIDLRNSAVTAIFTIDDGDTSDFISIIRLANFTIRVQIRRAGASIASIITSSPVALGVHKIALGYKNADYALYIDGVSAGTSANSTDYPATALTQCVLSNASYGPLNDRIRAYALYQTRLPNTTTDGSPSLQSITTL